MQNDDFKGFFKYLFAIVVEMMLPLLWFALFIICLGLGANGLDIPNFIAIVAVILLLITPIIYFLLPIIVTILAIKNHWSSYLDRFFNKFKLPTIILGIVMFIIIIYEKYHIMIDFSYSRFWVLFYYAIVPPYCLIYLVILVHNIIKKIKAINNE